MSFSSGKMRGTELDYLVGLRTLLLLILLVSTETFIEHKVHRQDGKPKMMRYIKRTRKTVSEVGGKGQSKISKQVGDRAEV